MSNTTKIEWPDYSWSPWEGCTKVSPGCLNCYAEARDRRMLIEKVIHWGKGAPRRRTKDWTKPVRWNRYLRCDCGAVKVAFDAPKEITRCPKCESPYRRPRVFPSVMDWLDDEVPIEWLLDFLKLIHDTPNLDWLLLTKRPEQFGRIKDIHAQLRHLYLKSPCVAGGYTEAGLKFYSWLTRFVTSGVSNVWVGTSVEDQQRADERTPELLRIPAKVRFLSLEPLLGPVNLNSNLGGTRWIGGQRGCLGTHRGIGTAECPRTPHHHHDDRCQSGIDWLIIGGESGPGARPCNVEWVRDLVRQGQTAGVPVFVKQLGAQAWQSSLANGGLGDGPIFTAHPKGGDPAEWPEDLRIREFPLTTDH